MKILLLNTSERRGGAAVASHRLMRALQKQGVEAKMLVRDKQTEDDSVIPVSSSAWGKQMDFMRFAWERLVIFICNCFSRKNLFRVSIANTGTDITCLSEFWEADVIHIHWINQGFLSLSGIRKIIDSGKPIVWTLHDMWPCTGICHYPADCWAYRDDMCSGCPMLMHLVWDLSHQVFREKARMAWEKVHFVGCSQWITCLGKASRLLQNAHFHSIPNPIDTSIFHPREKVKVREMLGLPPDKRLVLFGAARMSEKRKGASYLIDACRILASDSSIELVLMGDSGEELKDMLPVKAYTLGYLADAEQIAKAYSCADLFVIPSLEDNLPNTLMEAMACGTPCVGFDTGGIPEMIDHLENGYVAKYQDAEDLARGIRWVIDYPDKVSLTSACVEKVRRCYAEEVVSGQYIRLYQELLGHT